MGIRQSCGKARKVLIYAYGGKPAEIWWDKIKNNMMRFDNLQMVNFSHRDTAALAKLTNRAMKLQINIQDGDVLVSVGDTIANVTPQTWKLLARLRRSSRNQD